MTVTGGRPHTPRPAARAAPYSPMPSSMGRGLG